MMHVLTNYNYTLYDQWFTVENGKGERFCKLWLMMCPYRDIKPRTLLAFVFGKQKLLLRTSIYFSLMMDNMNPLLSFTLVLNRFVNDYPWNINVKAFLSYFKGMNNVIHFKRLYHSNTFTFPKILTFYWICTFFKLQMLAISCSTTLYF